jgi:hypothetical protein
VVRRVLAAACAGSRPGHGAATPYFLTNIAWTRDIYVKVRGASLSVT